MLSIVANIFYVLIAIAMVVLILLQRGAGAAAGSGFGGGASATVFGARGSANFLSRTTAVLAGLFFLFSLGMGMYVGRSGSPVQPADDLGLMSGAASEAKPAPATPVGQPASSGEKPSPAAASSSDKPAPAPVENPASAKDQPAPPQQGGKEK